MTGCYAPRIGTQFHRKSVEVPMPHGLKMFPAYLREAGYFTANNNKKDYNAAEGDGVWDESSKNATWRNRSENQPFFFMQSFATTHESSLHFPASDLNNKPTTADPALVTLTPYHPDTPMFRYTYARYLDRIQQVDKEIGQVVNKLSADGLLDDTFIFYFGDHGGVLPRGKGFAYESGLHVPLVVRVPKKWKHLVDANIPSRLNGFVSFIDFGATLLNLAGLDIPQQIDGRPFLGNNISSKQLARRDETFGYADRFDEKYDMVRTIRKGRYKYIRNYQPFNIDALQNNYRYRMAAYKEWRQLNEEQSLNKQQRQFFEPRPNEQLFDLEVDPHETVNLANQPGHRNVLLSLRKRLTEHTQQLPDLSFLPENELAETAFDRPVEFGLTHKTEIAGLIELADTPLLFGDEQLVQTTNTNSEAKTSAVLQKLRTSLSDQNPWRRYWSLIAISSIGTQYGWDHVSAFRLRVSEIARLDAEPAVQVRAAEFLGLADFTDPRPVLVDIINQSESALQTGLALNTVTLLQTVNTKWKFDIHSFEIPPDQRKFDVVQRRLEFLAE